MLHLQLHDHSVHPWQSGENLWFRGWFFHEGRYYDGSDAHLHLLPWREELEAVLPRLNGMYAIISAHHDQAWLAVDRVRSFPLFIAAGKSSRWTVTDRVESLPEVRAAGSVDESAVREYLATGFVTGRRTLYQHVSQLEAGQYVTVTGPDVHTHNYYTHHHSAGTAEAGEHLARLNEVVGGVFDRLATSLKGRQVALLLSGGYNSRLVATGLRRAGYKNVVCLSFGKDRSREVRVAREVARELGYPWQRIEVPPGWLRRKFATKRFREFILNAGNGASTPYYMGLLIEQAVGAGLVDRKAVVVTGSTGDLLEGDQMTPSLVGNETSTLDELIDAIVSRHYMLWGKEFGELPEFRELIAGSFPRGQATFSRDEALDIEERFNWRERQAKYVVQDARCYDEFLGMDWRFPLWDHEFMDFWLQVPSDLRAGRRLYLEWVRGESFRTANVTTLKMRVAAWVKRRSSLLTDALYPLEKLRHFLFSGDPYYVVGLREYLEILRLTGGHRTTTFTTHLFREMIEIYSSRLQVSDPRALMRAAVRHP